MIPQTIIRPATSNDRGGISSLLENGRYVHRHLDWRPPLEWLGQRPFWLLERNQHILSALSCPSEIHGITWIRLFAAATTHKPSTEWNQLLSTIQDELLLLGYSRLVALGIHSWFAGLLLDSGFSHHQDIIILEWNEKQPSVRNASPSLLIRPMTMSDFSHVHTIDNLAFEDIWQNSLLEIRQAFLQSSYATVAEIDGEVVGFQFSTSSPFTAHLARLAVLPEWRRQAIGYELVRNLLIYFRHTGLEKITVNTQNTNFASIALYNQLGFFQTGESFPVFSLQIAPPS